MKPTEEIKKGLRQCSRHDPDENGGCEACPYDSSEKACGPTLARDALAYIEQLEEESKRLKKEGARDEPACD